jgi:hypothetical protein
MLVDSNAIARRGGLAGHVLNATVLTPHDRQLNSLTSQLNSRRASDPTRGPGEDDDGHVFTVPPGPRHGGAREPYRGVRITTGIARSVLR